MAQDSKANNDTRLLYLHRIRPVLTLDRHSIPKIQPTTDQASHPFGRPSHYRLHTQLPVLQSLPCHQLNGRKHLALFDLILLRRQSKLHQLLNRTNHKCPQGRITLHTTRKLNKVVVPNQRIAHKYLLYRLQDPLLSLHAYRYQHKRKHLLPVLLIS